MNLREFKETVSAWENYEEKFRLFRVWGNNCYDAYCKEKTIAYAEKERFYDNEQDFFYSEEKQTLDFEWIYIGYDVLNNLYSRMGWELEDNIKNRKITLDIDTDSLYYFISLGDVFFRLEKVEDDIEYAYASFLLIDSVYKKTELYKKYFKKVYRGIAETNLHEAFKLLSNNKKVFVAMWFSDKMKAAREKIECAIRDCGYEPMLIDIKEHNNQIVPEIFKEIEDSEFVIADLTGNRGGVYYEAGFATARGKQVILSCKEKTKIHFDVAQINTIYWRDEDDLYERLVKRINATVGENN